MSATTTQTGGTFITPVVRLSYPTLFVPRLGKDPKPGDKARFSVVGLILPPEKMDSDRDRTLWTNLQKGIIAAGREKMGDEKFKLLWEDGKIKTPIRKDIKSSGYPEDFACYLRAWSYQQPGVVAPAPGGGTMPVTDPNKLYPGCWARLSLRPWCGYHETGGWSIGLQLQNVLFWKDDSRLDGKTNAADEFGDLAAEAPASSHSSGGGSDEKDEITRLLGG